MKVSKHLITLLSALFFLVLFYQKTLGLNVALYGILTVLLLAVFKPAFLVSRVNKIVTAGFLISTIFFYLYASPFTLFVVIASFLLLIGLHTTTPIRNIIFALGSALPNYFASIGEFFSSLKSRRLQKRSLGLHKLFRIAFVPMFIVLLFIALYSMGSSFFSDAIGSMFTAISDFFSRISQYISVVAIFVGLVGVLLGAIHSLNMRTNTFSELDAGHFDILTRVKYKVQHRFRNLDLNIEYKSGVFLFAALSLLLTLLVILEIKNIWINFDWTGELLKGMVHEGTFVLIFAILVSMAVTLFYFRKNLNFYKKNTTLKCMAYIWIGLNALLVVSVFVRNAHYIHYFGLAYKRIGVIFFLVLCFIGLVTLVVKIAKVKTTYYVVRVNALVAYVALVSICMVNWDSLIARYNFAHYKTAYIYLPFMADLSDKALPYLKLTDDQIVEIESKQAENIPLARKGNFKDVDYKNKIDGRIASFQKRHKNRHWLERVWAEDRAYSELSSH